MMKRFQNSFLSDVAYLLFIVLCIVITIYVSSDSNAFISNIILLNAALLIAIVTYFTTIMTGLILNLLFIFGYGSFTIYQSVTVGSLVDSSNYFWLVATPVLTILSWMLTQTNRKLQEENERLHRQTVSLAMIDEKTKLKNTLSYQQDIRTFMALSERYSIPLTLMVINVKYWDEIKRIMTAEQLSSALLEVSDISQSLVRTNDSLYLLNNENPTWGIVLFTDIEGAEIVVKRLKDKINEMNDYTFKTKYSVELQLRIGTAQYDAKNAVSPLELISLAKRTMEYDV